MRFPIDEKTGKPYGMAKGEKPQDMGSVDLSKENEQRLATASLDVETRRKAMGPDSVKKKPLVKAEPAKLDKKSKKKK